MLEFKGISKSYTGVEVLNNISFDVDAGNILVLMGENGAGKSTLMKILSGIITDYTGSIFIDGEVKSFKGPKNAEEEGISIIHQELNLFPDLSIAENLLIGREPKKNRVFIDFESLHARAAEILKEFNFPYSTKTKLRNIGVGWQQIVEIARVINLNSKIVIMDEPTSALSDSEILILFEKIKLLKEKGKLIIYISHRMNEIFEIADEIAVLRDGRFIEKKSVSEINRDELVKLMVGKNVHFHKEEKVITGSQTILSVSNLCVSIGSKKILNNISFSLGKGEILGIAGLLGAGRSSLLKFIYGQLNTSYQGEIIYKDESYSPESPSKSIKKRIIYLTENRKSEGIFPNHNIVFNGIISVVDKISRFNFVDDSRAMSSTLNKLNEMNIKMNSIKQSIESLSGGNQQKVLLTRVLLTDPELLLLDEPTRGIDVNAKYEIYDLIEKLSSAGISIILTSSEIPELLKICSRILVLSNGYQTDVLNAHKTNSKEILHKAFLKV